MIANKLTKTLMLANQKAFIEIIRLKNWKKCLASIKSEEN